MKKVLIIYASAGDGHKKSAEAIYDSFLKSKDKDIKVHLVNALDHATGFFKISYEIIYLLLIKYMPRLWGFFYHMLNNRFFYTLSRPFRRAINALNSGGLKKFLLKEDFDVIISTHFFATEVISVLKGKGILSAPLLTVLTDYRPHLFWIAENVDLYTVAATSTKNEFAERGVEKEKIVVTGIPMHNKFNLSIPKTEARKKMGLDANVFTALVMGGGLGVGPIEETVSALQGLDFDCQIITICGKNKGLFKKLKAKENSFKKKTKVFGFFHEVDMAMAASDIMVSKLGGITVSESLARRLPVITINPIPGQEMYNAEFLFENEVGFKLKSVDELNQTVTRFFNAPQEAKRLKEKIGHLSRPNAAGDIKKLAIGMIR